MSLQIGNFNPDGSQNTTGSPAGNNVPNLVQMVVLNYMALHSANAISQWPTLWPAPNLNNGLGLGHGAGAVDRLATARRSGERQGCLRFGSE